MNPTLRLPPLPLLLRPSVRSFTSTSHLHSTKDHLTPSESEAKRLEEVDTTPPPYLSRALGVKEPPTIGKQSREEWRAELLSHERRINERRHLVKQVSKGYFHDYNELRHKGGKSWIAPNTLIREDVRPSSHSFARRLESCREKLSAGIQSETDPIHSPNSQLSLYFPDIEGLSLLDKTKLHTTDLFPDKVSLVVLSSFQSSEEHINSFVRPTLADLKDDPNFQYVYVRFPSPLPPLSSSSYQISHQINLQENPLKSFIVNLFLSSLRRTVPPAQQRTYLLSHQNLEYLREPLGMQNKHVGYVFLVDWEKRVRWAGCSWATLDEEEALRKCSHVLVKRLQERIGEGMTGRE